MDNLQGRNDELRAALREIRHESSKAVLEREKALDKVLQWMFLFSAFCLFDFLILYTPINNHSVMSGQVFLG